MAQTGTLIVDDVLPLEPIVANIACSRVILSDDALVGFILHMPHADDPGFLVHNGRFEIYCYEHGCLQGEVLGYVESLKGIITLHTYMD